MQKENQGKEEGRKKQSERKVFGRKNKFPAFKKNPVPDIVK